MSLEEIFTQTISPDPAARKQAEDFLCANISNQPHCAIDVLTFATDWHSANSGATVWSRLAAAIFLKNMILRSPWGSGDLLRAVAARQQQQAPPPPNTVNALFANFLPPPPLQEQIRNQLVRAMFLWRPSLRQQQQHQQQQFAFVEETILRYVETAVEAIHDADWPFRWPDLFSQTVTEFETNALPACERALGEFVQLKQQQQQQQQQRRAAFMLTEHPQFVQNCIVPFTESLFGGTAALCLVKLCCKRLFDPEDSQGTAPVDDDTMRQMLMPLGQRVLVPFLRLVSSVEWVDCFMRASFVLETANNSNSNNNSSLQLIAQLELFCKAWMAFTFEGIKAIVHLSQTQIFAAMLDAQVPVSHHTAQQGGEQQQQPFVFVASTACTRIHHALFCRMLWRRETFFTMKERQQQNVRGLETVQSVFRLDSRDESGGAWKLWKEVWALQQILHEHFAEIDLCPAKIRKGHSEWFMAWLAPAIPCALAMAILHDNRPSWRMPIIDNDLEIVCEAAAAPGPWAMANVVRTFVTACAAEATNRTAAATTSGNNVPLAIIPFCNAAFRSPTNNCEALSYAFDVIETSVRFLPSIWWDDLLLPESLRGPNLFSQLLQQFPADRIGALFQPTNEQFAQCTGNMAWFVIAWLLLPRLSIDGDEVEQWEINPEEYLSSQADPNQDLFNLRSSARRLIACFMSARRNDKTSKKQMKRMQQQQQQNHQAHAQQQKQQAADIIKTRVHFMVDFAYLLLNTSANPSSGTLDNSNFNVSDPHPGILAADAALLLLRMTKKAVCERNDAEDAILCGVLPLFKARFGPLRAKAAQVASEMCQDIAWGGSGNNYNEDLARENFQKVLVAALDLMYDSQLQVRMQVCTRLSPLIRHRLAGTVVVPHLVRIVQQFFDVLVQNQNETVVATLRKLFAHYRQHMGQWAVDLARIILGRFEQVVGVLMRMSPDDIADEIGLENTNNVEFNQAASGNNNSSRNNRQQREQENSAIHREMLEATAVGDELLAAISTIVKCVPRASTILSLGSSDNGNNSNNNPQEIEEQRQQHTATCMSLQELLGPMLLAMFESPNSMGFFEGGLRLISSLLTRSTELHPATWEVFVALFRVVCVRDATDYFSNMISAVDNFASVDPVGLIIGRSSRPPQSEHPGEGGRFIGMALEMVRAVVRKGSVPLSDAANAVQCVDCLLLNAARCNPESVVSSSSPAISAASGVHKVRQLSAQDLVQQQGNNPDSNDPLCLQGFINIPVDLSIARQQRLPAAARRMNLVATPSMCVLLSNSVFCCVLAACPARLLATERQLQSRALLSFSLVSRLFEHFGGVGSGNFHRQSELHRAPVSFRVYDRKLFVLAVAHFLRQLVLAEGSSSSSAIFETLQAEGYGSSPDELVPFFRILLWTATCMLVETAYFDCRMLESIQEMEREHQQQQQQGGNTAQHGNSGGGDFDTDEDDSMMDGDDEDDMTDVTTDDDGDDDDLNLFGGGDDEDDDDEDDEFGGDMPDDNDLDEGDVEAYRRFDGDNHSGGMSKNAMVSRLAAQAAQFGAGGDEGDDGFTEEDDFGENLLLDFSDDNVETPLDPVDEFRVFGEVIASILHEQQQQQQQTPNQQQQQRSIRYLVATALTSLENEHGAVPVARMRYDSPPANAAGGRRGKKNKKKQQQRVDPHQQQQQQRGEQVFALLKAKRNNSAEARLPLIQFLQECSQQRSQL